MHIREARPDDADALKALYTEHLTQRPPEHVPDGAKWADLLRIIEEDGNYHLLVGEIDGMVVSSVTLIVIRNLTHGLRPYAVIENVVTHAEYRNRGCASALMQRAGEIARQKNCYKIMLMTGAKKAETLRFYERCGYNKNDKTAFIKWL